MTDERRPQNTVSLVRGTVVSALLGGGTLVMLADLFEKKPDYAIGAIVIGVVLLGLIRRKDVRSLVYAFFVPTTMAYGAVTEHVAMLLLGGAAGVFFLLESRRSRDDGESS